ncbi:sequestosome-1 [Orussus abietinus]|uniref:sequestosome-1 n=1 Tax=Orussus abietinus TaxID=222816 RepID=UPI0006269F11|nr:sequestosome-1 [Orussus abietinus]
MDSVVKFKAYLIQYDDDDASKYEVRKFNVDGAVTTSYEYICGRLRVVFPVLRQKDFTVTWHDSEDDEIVISSDEELQIAFFEMTSAECYKFYIRVQSDSPKTTIQTTDTGPAILHVGIECNGCDGNVKGFRYKCLECKDFDLCQDCESKGQHAEHCMIRLNTPLTWKPHYQKKLSRQFQKFVRNGERPSHEENQKDCPFKANKRYPTTCPYFGPQNSWLETFTTFLNDWSNLPTDGECPMKEKPEKTEQPAAGELNKSPEKRKDLDIGAEFIQNIETHIAQLLSPLGINVDLQIKSDDTKPGPSTSTTATPQNSQTKPDASQISSKNKQAGNDTKLETSINGNVPSPALKIPSTSGTETLAEKTNVDGDWTLLNTSESSSKSETNVRPDQNLEGAPSAPIEESQASQMKENLYPVLNKDHVVFHSDPKIQQGIATLTQMGFSDGILLTQLLVSRKGDISKVLDDILQTKR